MRVVRHLKIIMGVKQYSENDAGILFVNYGFKAKMSLLDFNFEK